MSNTQLEKPKRRTFGGNFNLILTHKDLNPFQKKERNLERKHLKAYLKGHKFYDFKMNSFHRKMLPTKLVLVNYI
jgi:hypothetical protein